MIGKCVFLLIFTSLVYSAAAGDISVLSGAVIEGCSSAVNLIFSMCGMMCLWCGILEVLKKAGAIGKLSSVMAPLLRFIFPDSASTPACEVMTAAICANILGIGNASTPLALRSMEMLDRQNPAPEKASRDMITFAVLGTAPFSVMPTTVVTLLSSLGCTDAFRITVPVWISSGITCAFALILCRAIGGLHKYG